MGLSIIHLSDIHIKGKEDAVFNKIKALKSACTGAIVSGSQVVIAITGDVAFSGKIEQYELAKQMIEELAKYIKDQTLSEVSIVCVPGNHDCDFAKESNVRSALVSSVKPESLDGNYYNMVCGVQENYNVFASTFDLETGCVLPTKTIQIGDDKVLFVLANTSWMSVLDEVPGKIVMPCGLFPTIQSNEFRAIFYLYHHPENWMNPDYKSEFIDNVRGNADFILVGHEHTRDNYQKVGTSFSLVCNHGKELQDSNNNDSSAFSIINFDDAFQVYKVIDFEWTNTKYTRTGEYAKPFHKNIASTRTVFHPNATIAEYINDVGITINHFAKDKVVLSDVFVWPDLRRLNYKDHNSKPITVKTEIAEEIFSNDIAIVSGLSTSGKTAVAKMLYARYFNSNEECCVLFNGSDFKTSEVRQIADVIESTFVDQYDAMFLEDFRQLPKEKRVAVVDDFDLIKISKDRRSIVLDYLTGFFGKVVIFIAASMEITSFITSKTLTSLSDVLYYEILPLGNRKRKEIISQWYSLDESLPDDELENRIQSAMNQMDTFLGNGTGVIPAYPVFVIGTLQNSDAKNPSYSGSKYAFLYESLILNSLSKISFDYLASGERNIDTNILMRLAYHMLSNGKGSFLKNELVDIIDPYNKKMRLGINVDVFLEKMQRVQILHQDRTNGEQYKFKYPYIYYYFAGKYIEKNRNEKDVKQLIEHMSSKLYVETYGSIIIFICHFSNSQEVIDNILLNAYGTLDNYSPFDFNNSNPIFDEIRDAVEALIPESVVTNEGVEDNKNRALVRMDEVGINDGTVKSEEDDIDEELEDKEKEIAAVTASLKTLEVLGQILQTYPGEIDAEAKESIIDEMHKLGMRSIQAIINTMGYLEKELVEFIIEKEREENKKHRREDIAAATRRFINLLISGMVQGMVHQVASCLNSSFILDSATDVFTKDTSISSKLILLDLKLNVLKKPSYKEIESLKKTFKESNERFAACILDSIVGYYLNYNKCDHVLRSKLCKLCDIPERDAIVAVQKNLLN